MALPLGSANYGLADKSVLPPVLVNQVSSEHTHTYLFMDGLQHENYSLSSPIEKNLPTPSLPHSAKDLKQLTLISNPKDIWNFLLKFPCNFILYEKRLGRSLKQSLNVIGLK